MQIFIVEQVVFFVNDQKNLLKWSEESLLVVRISDGWKKMLWIFRFGRFFWPSYILLKISKDSSNH